MLRPRSSSNTRPASSSTSGAAGGASSGAPPPGLGLGAGAVPDVNPSSRGAQVDRGLLLEEKPKTEVSQRLLMSRGGVLGMPAKLHARPWERGGQTTDSARPEGGDAPPTNPALGAASRPGTLNADGGVDIGGGRFSEDATTSAAGALEDRRQDKKTIRKTPWQQDTYASIAMYFRRFNGPKILLLPGDPFLLRSSSKSTQRRPKWWT